MKIKARVMLDLTLDSKPLKDQATVEQWLRHIFLEQLPEAGLACMDEKSGEEHVVDLDIHRIAIIVRKPEKRS